MSSDLLRLFLRKNAWTLVWEVLTALCLELAHGLLQQKLLPEKEFRHVIANVHTFH